MKVALVLHLASVAVTTSAFSPSLSRYCNGRLEVSLEMANGERRAKFKRAAKNIGKFVFPIATIALSTCGVPPPALAWVRATSETTKQVADVTSGVTQFLDVASSADQIVQVASGAKHFVESASGGVKLFAGVAAASLAVGAAMARILYKYFGADSLAVTKINRVFAGARPYRQLVAAVSKTLQEQGFKKKNTLLVTSFSPDELARGLEKEFAKIYNDNYNLGGICGFPFGGNAAFFAMTQHIPDNGNCLIVFGPHVGIDSDGYVGAVERRGRRGAGPCCDSAVAASNYVHGVFRNEVKKALATTDPMEVQQYFVGNLLLPHAARLDQAAEKMVELPYALYDGIKEMMYKLVEAGARNVSGDGKIAVLGGIQLSTPPGRTDYFLPLTFGLIDNQGNLLEDMLPSIKQQ